MNSFMKFNLFFYFGLDITQVLRHGFLTLSMDWWLISHVWLHWSSSFSLLFLLLCLGNNFVIPGLRRTVWYHETSTLSKSSFLCIIQSSLRFVSGLVTVVICVIMLGSVSVSIHFLLCWRTSIRHRNIVCSRNSMFCWGIFGCVLRTCISIIWG